jgi:PAS domain S-box-containing protein
MKSEKSVRTKLIDALNLFYGIPDISFSALIYYDSKSSTFQKILAEGIDRDRKQDFLGIPFPYHFRVITGQIKSSGDLAAEYEGILKSQSGREFLVKEIADNKDLYGMLVLLPEQKSSNNLLEEALLIAEPVFLYLLEKLSKNRNVIDDQIFLRNKFAELAQSLILNDSIDDVSLFVLEYAKQLTECRFGYVGYIEKETGYLIAPTMTRDIWDKCNVENKSIVFKEFGGLWGWVLKNKEPILTNDPANDPRSTGTPEGHIEISNFISVPVMAGDELIGQIALANSPRPFHDSDLRTIEQLGYIYGLAIDKLRKFEELKISEEIMDSAINPIAIIDPTGSILYNNKSFANILGSNQKNGSEKKSIMEYFVSQENFSSILSKLEQGSEFLGELKLLSTDNSIIDVMLTAKAIYKEDGTIRVIHFIFMDISEILAVRSEVRKSGEIFRKVWEKSREAMRIVNDQGIIQMVNDAYCELVGKPKNRLLGKPFSIVYKESVRNRVLKTFKNRYTRGEFKKSYITKILLWNEKEIWLSITHSFIEIPNEMPLFLNIFRDITEQKKQENKIRDYMMKLEELNANKDKLFSIVSHDLRSPFHGLIGISDSLMKKHREISQEKLSDSLTLLHNTIRNVFGLLENVLNWSRLQTDRLEVTLTGLELKAEVNVVFSLLKINADMKSISLINNIPDNLIVYADKQMLNSVMQNLIGNAIKFSNTGGKVTVDAMEDKKKCRVKVIDNGIGISKGKLDDIFNVSIQSSNSGTQNESGTGLGLYICKEFIERMNGYISMESTLKKGTIVSFTLPLFK